MLLGEAFMSTWHIVVFSIAMTADQAPRRNQWEKVKKKFRPNAGRNYTDIP